MSPQALTMTARLSHAFFGGLFRALMRGSLGRQLYMIFYTLNKMVHALSPMPS
jgi:hypothetical protein